jgi:hypothetical protein
MFLVRMNEVKLVEDLSVIYATICFVNKGTFLKTWHELGMT